MGPRAGLDDIEEWKRLPPPALKLRPLGRPVRSQSLYRLRYPGYSYVLYITIVLKCEFCSCYLTQAQWRICSAELPLTGPVQPIPRSWVLLRTQQSLIRSGIYQHFMQPEGSLSCSQEPDTDPYPEPDESSPYHTILFLLTSFLIISYVCVFIMVSVLLDFPQKPCMHSAFLLCLLHTVTISSSLTWSCELYLAKSTSYEAPHYAVFHFISLGSNRPYGSLINCKERYCEFCILHFEVHACFPVLYSPSLNEGQCSASRFGQNLVLSIHWAVLLDAVGEFVPLLATGTGTSICIWPPDSPDFCTHNKQMTQIHSSYFSALEVVGHIQTYVIWWVPQMELLWGLRSGGEKSLVVTTCSFRRVLMSFRLIRVNSVMCTDHILPPNLTFLILSHVGGYAWRK
jgi:hypothetical protein